MKQYILPLLILALTSCITNDGDIGDMYGLWKLSELSVDGTSDPAIQSGDYYFRFQNNIVCITQRQPYNDFTNTYGTWTLADDVLSLNFTHHNDTEGSGTSSKFVPPAQLHIPGPAVTAMHVISMDHRHMSFGFTSDDGVRYVYVLDKSI